MFALESRLGAQWHGFVKTDLQGLDQFYKPLHVIDYYRFVTVEATSSPCFSYLVFFENGDVCTMTTPETPDQVVSTYWHGEVLTPLV